MSNAAPLSLWQDISQNQLEIAEARFQLVEDPEAIMIIGGQDRRGEVTYVTPLPGLYVQDFVRFCPPNNDRAVAAMGSVYSRVSAFVYRRNGYKRSGDRPYVPRELVHDFAYSPGELTDTKRIARFVLDHTEPSDPAFILEPSGEPALSVR